MVDHIAEGLNIKTGYNIEVIEKIDGKWRIDNDGVYDKVISTIPLPVLPILMKLPENIVSYIKGLRYNSLITVLFDCPKTDITWLYIPSHDYRSHRVGYQSALTPYANPNSERGCGALEIIGGRFEVNDKLVHDNTLPKELGFDEILDHEFTEYAYIIHDKGYEENVKNIREYFAKDDSFNLLGRWGTWKLRDRKSVV